jgi:hypothetical protein
MINTNEFYSKEFFSGLISISREELESLPCPFCTKNVTDENMQAIIDMTCEQTKMRMGLSQKDAIDISDERTNEIWWQELEQTVVAFKVPYYEDMDMSKH